MQDTLRSSVTPFVSCKLHRGWIADIQFLAAGNSAPDTLPWVASASNDGSLAVWACDKINPDGALASVASTTEVHNGGIFSMHAQPRTGAAVDILKASKDASVKHSQLDQAGSFSIVRTWDDVHGGVAKSVRWRNSHTAASSGNDRHGPAQPVQAPLHAPHSVVCTVRLHESNPQ